MRVGPGSRWGGAHAPVGPFGLTRSSRQAAGLALWYPFVGNAATGATGGARDYAGRHGPATPVGAAGVEITTRGPAPFLPGTTGSDYWSLPLPLLDLNATFTASFWAATRGSGSGNHLLLHLAQATTEGLNVYATSVAASGNIALSNVWTGWAFDDTGVAPLATGAWGLYTFVLDAAAARFYLNGSQIWSATPRTTTLGTVTEHRFGARSDDGTVYGNADFQDLRFYSRALSPTEVWQLYAPATRWELYRVAAPRLPTGTIAVQYLRPASDVAGGTWTPVPGSPTTLYTKLDEAAADDADYAYSATYPASDVMTVALSSATDPTSSTGHVVRYRYRNNNGGGAGTLQIELLQGTTVLDTWSHTGITSATWVTASRTLSGAVADSITDYTSLRLRFTASVG